MAGENDGGTQAAAQQQAQGQTDPQEQQQSGQASQSVGKHTKTDNSGNAVTSVHSDPDTQGPEPRSLVGEQAVSRDDDYFGEAFLDVLAGEDVLEGQVCAVMAFPQHDSGTIPGVCGEELF